MKPAPVDMTTLLTEIAGVYEAGHKPGEPHVALTVPAGDHAPAVGRDGPLGQVFRNLVDNARSFSPPHGSVRIALKRDDIDALAVHVLIDDDGRAFRPRTSRRCSSASTPRGRAGRPRLESRSGLVDRAPDRRGARGDGEGRQPRGAGRRRPLGPVRGRPPAAPAPGRRA